MSMKISFCFYRTAIRYLSTVVALLLTLQVLTSMSSAQGTLDKKTSQTSVDDLEFLENEYGTFQKQGFELQNRFERIVKVFSDSEKDMKAIQNETLRQQMNQANADIRQMFLQIQQQSVQAAANQAAANQAATNQAATNQSARNQQNDRNLTQQSNRLAVEEAQLGLGNFARSQQMAQLSASQQLVFRNYQQAMGDFQILSIDFQKWQIQSIEYLRRYWRFSDPEGMNSSKLNEQRLQILKQSEPSNPYALLTRGLLAIRVDNENEAEESLTRISMNGGPISPIADAGLALLYSIKKQKQKSQESLRRAKVGQSNFAAVGPYVSWLFAQVSMAQHGYPAALKELDRLMDIKEFDLPSRRQITLIRSLEGKAKHKPSEKNLKNIRLVSDFSGRDDWYTELVYAMCLYTNDFQKEAMTRAEHALEIVPEDRRVECKKVLDAIADGTELTWAFWN